ncbi:MAG: hypothetical protein PHQ43_08185 [Dehalococcoidales bacterium]|nr:hypothetical protein [Dehalococcoidales bacterium]
MTQKYRVTFEIDAHGTHVDEIVEATASWRAVDAARIRRHDKAGYVVDCQEIREHKFALGDRVRIARKTNHRLWMPHMDTRIGHVGEITELPSSHGPGYKVITDHPNDCPPDDGYYYPEDSLEMA